MPATRFPTALGKVFAIVRKNDNENEDDGDEDNNKDDDAGDENENDDGGYGEDDDNDHHYNYWHPEYLLIPKYQPKIGAIDTSFQSCVTAMKWIQPEP